MGALIAALPHHIVSFDDEMIKSMMHWFNDGPMSR
jgi:hypothetical protein